LKYLDTFDGAVPYFIEIIPIVTSSPASVNP